MGIAYDWTGAADGDLNNPANFNVHLTGLPSIVVPTTGDTVTIPNGSGSNPIQSNGSNPFAADVINNDVTLGIQATGALTFTGTFHNNGIIHDQTVIVTFTTFIRGAGSRIINHWLGTTGDLNLTSNYYLNVLPNASDSLVVDMSEYTLAPFSGTSNAGDLTFTQVTILNNATLTINGNITLDGNSELGEVANNNTATYNGGVSPGAGDVIQSGIFNSYFNGGANIVGGYFSPTSVVTTLNGSIGSPTFDGILIISDLILGTPVIHGYVRSGDDPTPIQLYAQASDVRSIGPWPVTATHVGPFPITATHLGPWPVN